MSDIAVKMRDIKSPKIIWFKGGLFFLIGLASAVLLLIESPTLRSALLLAVAIWAFCRSYYFAFYVIENYVDPSYHFSGLFSFCRYLLRKRAGAKDRS
jgi:hypothetical protein